MATRRTTVAETKEATVTQPTRTPARTLLDLYECGPVAFSGRPTPRTSGTSSLTTSSARSVPTHASVSRPWPGALRDLLSQRWLKTDATYDRTNPKQVYYLSMEFLIGRSLANNILNLQVEPVVREAMEREKLDWAELAEIEPDAGLGNGGLGRLAACFLDSMATLELPAIGYGLRYEYGIFRQEIDGGQQVEHPDHWLRHPDPWEVVRPRETVDVGLNCAFRLREGRMEVDRDIPTILVGTPYDRPVVGYGGRTINTLRLWGAATHQDFNFVEFSRGDFFDAVHEKVAAESLTRVLYPDDSTPRGKGLRFVQEYFLVACSLADIVARFRRRGNDWHALARQGRDPAQRHPPGARRRRADAHPARSGQARLGRSLGPDRPDPGLHQSHPAARGARDLAGRSLRDRLPRHLEIIYEINRRFLDDVRARYPGDEDRVRRVSLIQEGPEKRVRMAHLAIVGSHSTNGVAAIHSHLLRAPVVRGSRRVLPERSTTRPTAYAAALALAGQSRPRPTYHRGHRRWLDHQPRSAPIVPLTEDPAFRDGFRRTHRAAKARFAAWLKSTTGQTVDPDTIFDSQIKFIHEYKRQLLNVLHILVLYNRLRENPRLDVPPRTFFFAGKAAPAYALAKLIIKLINNVAAVIDADPAIRGRLKVLFLPEYNVSLAQRLIPASDVSEQISTAGTRPAAPAT